MAHLVCGMLGLALFLALVVAAPAQAHDQLVAASPEPDSVIAAAPAEVALTYSADILPIGATIVVVDSDQQVWTTGDVAVAGAVARQPLSAGMPDGAYQVRWQVVSSDGHTISGYYDFTIGAAAVAPVAIPGADAEPATVPAAAASTPTWLEPVLTALAGATVGGLLFTVVVLARRHARTDPDQPRITPEKGIT